MIILDRITKEIGSKLLNQTNAWEVTTKYHVLVLQVFICVTFLLNICQKPIMNHLNEGRLKCEIVDLIFKNHEKNEGTRSTKGKSVEISFKLQAQYYRINRINS
jgi:hypothetical protein